MSDVKECDACSQRFDEDNNPVSNAISSTRCGAAGHEGPVTRFPSAEAAAGGGPRAVNACGNVLQVSALSQSTLSEVGTLWEIVHIDLSGLSAKSNVYVRHAVKTVWDELEKLTNANRMIINGSPGIGKSTELYGWFQYKLRTCAIIWIHYSKSFGIHVVYAAKGNKLERVVFHHGMEKQVVFQCPQHFRNLGVKIVICDGFPHDFGMLPVVLSLFQESILIYCTSYHAAGSLNASDKEDLREGFGYVTMSMDAWSLDELKSAFQKDVFKGRIANEAELEDRYYYGGGSVRLILASIPDSIADINAAVEKCRNLETLGDGITGQSSDSALNDLFQTFGGVYSLVSYYARKELRGKISLDFVVNARNMLLTNNPAFHDWILELEALKRIESREIVLSPPEHPWNDYAYMKEFMNASDIDMTTLQPNTLLLPLKFNQGLFNAMLYIRKGQVRLLGITIARIHLYHMQNVVPFLELFKDENGRCSITFDIVIPRENREIYSISTTHFKNKRSVERYDDKWALRVNLATSTLCNVFLMDRHERISTPLNDTYVINGRVVDVGVPLAALTTVKRRRINDGGVDQEIDDEVVSNDPNIVDFYV